MGRMASLVVAGMILLSLRVDIVLLTKSCLIPLSLMKKVPPMTGLWSFLQTSALKVSGFSSLKSVVLISLHACNIVSPSPSLDNCLFGLI